MNRQRILSMVLAIASAGQLQANTGSGTLTLLPAATGVNRLNVTVTATSNGIPVSDSDTTDVSGAIITSINANPTTGATTQLSITGGNLSLTDMNFVLRLLFVTVANINTTNMAGTAYTPSPPAPVTPAAGGGSFDASLHHLLLNSGTISGTALGNPVSADFATAPIDGAGSGTGGITMVAGSASATDRTFDATVTIPVDFTDNRDLNGTPVSIRVQGTLKAAGPVQVSLFGIRTWTGLATNLWNNAGNWDTLPVSGDSLIFSGTTRATNSNDLAADRLVAGITFSNTANGSNFNLSGNRVILGGNITASDTATTGDTINDTIALDLVLNADRTIQLGARHNLNLTGLVSSSGAFGLTKSGSGSLTLGGGNTYTGATRIENGLVKFGVNNALPAGTALTIGTGTTVGGLEPGTFSGTVASLAVTSNSASNNTLAIGTGKSLTVAGNFTVGFTSAANTTTKLAPTGLGTLNVTTGNIQIGGNTTFNASVGNAATLDLSGLANFSYVNSAGTLRVGDSGGNTGTGSSTLILADTSAITAQTVTMNSPTQVPHTIRLGSVANTINADTIQIGVATNRSGGTLNFNTTTGTLTVRNTAGSGRANMTVGYGPATTAVVSTNTMDLTGHACDLLLGTLQIAGRTSTQAGGVTGVFSFDSGTLDATGVTVGFRAGSGANRGLVDGTLNLGGGTVIIGASGLSVATNTASVLENSVSGAVNISGGTATMGQTGGTSITLGSSTNTSAATTTATLNLTGGTLTVAGDIVKGSTTGTVNSTLRLSGGTLDMGGNDIGATGSGAITLTAESGTLRNVASINGAGGLTKTTAGNLVLSGNNSYTGNTIVNNGTLSLTQNNALGTTAGNTTVNGSAAVSLAGTVLSFSDAAIGLTIGEHIELAPNSVGRATLRNDSAQDHIFNGNITLSGSVNGAQIWSSGAGAMTFNGDISGSVPLTLRGNSGSANNWLKGNITISGTGNALSKTQEGGTTLWTIGAPGKTFSADGGIAVTYGTLRIGAGANNYLASSTLLTMSTASGANGFFDLNGTAQTVAGIVQTGTLSTTKEITSSAAGAVLTVNNATDYDTTARIALTGQMALAKQGVGKLTLAGANTYSGNTTVSQGTLTLSNAPDPLNANTGNDLSTVTIAPGAVLEMTYTGTDIVDKLFFGTTQQPLGTYSASSIPAGATITTASFLGGGTLTVTSGPSATNYDIWATAKGLTGLPGSATDPAKTADPDKDGRNNLQEFAFDGDPLSGANDGKVVGKVATVGGSQVMTLTLPVRGTAPTPLFSDSSGDELSALIDGIHYRIEGDVNLSTFADDITEVTGPDAAAIQAGLPALSASPPNGWSYRTFRATPGTVTTVPKGFLRAKISETP